MNARIPLLALAFAAGCANAAPPVAAEAPDQNLRIAQHVTTIGKDGVQRETRYADRMIRRADSVWLEREMPAALQHGHDHAEESRPHVGHAHADTTGAPLWVQRGADGKPQVTMVLRGQRKLIEVDEPNYGNVGYTGSWASTYWVVDPARLKQMQVVGAPRGGVQQYRSDKDGRSLRIDWDIAGQYPRRIERRDAHGTSVSLTTVTTVAAPKTLPWRTVEGYARGDYSDLLD